MYQFSRSIYRKIAPDILPGHVGQDPTNQAIVLRACEQMMLRVASGELVTKNPTRALFREIRCYFPIGVQEQLLRTIEQHMNFTLALFDAQPELARQLAASATSCRALNRYGHQCQRMAQPGGLYCPSHQHLADRESSDVLVMQ